MNQQINVKNKKNCSKLYKKEQEKYSGNLDTSKIVDNKSFR